MLPSPSLKTRYHNLYSLQVHLKKDYVPAIPSIKDIFLALLQATKLVSSPTLVLPYTSIAFTGLRLTKSLTHPLDQSSDKA